MSDFQPVRDACRLVGNATKLAKLLGVSSNTVSEWARRKYPVPIIRCVEIEEITGGVVDRKKLRPNDWFKIWPEIRELD